MNTNTVKKMARDLADRFALETLCAIIKTERTIYRRTGCELPALRRYWATRGAKTQNRLNAEHGTRYEYGIYKY